MRIQIITLRQILCITIDMTQLRINVCNVNGVVHFVDVRQQNPEHSISDVA